MVDDRGDIGVADAAEGLDLAGQSGARGGIGGDMGAQHLDRYGLARRVEGEVHDPHAAFSELLQQAVRADPGEACRARLLPQRLRFHRANRKSPAPPHGPHQTHRTTLRSPLGRSRVAHGWVEFGKHADLGTSHSACFPNSTE